MRKNIFFLLILAPLTCSAAPFDEFEARVRSELIKPFALDLGGLLGAAGFHRGRALGFPGFELGVVGATQFRPDKDNLILRDAGVKALGLPLLHVAVGLPLKIDVVAHGLKAQNASIFGGGIRYGVFKSGLLTKFMPDLGVSIFADKVNHPVFNAIHYAGNVNAGWDLPIVKPFLGFGVDSTKVTVGAARTTGLTGLSATAKGTRLTAGADVTPLPLINLRAAYMLLHGVPGALFSLGAKF
jgi:hypothetical protein